MVPFFARGLVAGRSTKPTFSVRGSFEWTDMERAFCNAELRYAGFRNSLGSAWTASYNAGTKHRAECSSYKV